MVAPFPYEAVAGSVADPAEVEASVLYRQYAWIARLADEMNAEEERDLKRTMQLVTHIREFTRRFDNLKLLDQAAPVIARVFALKKCLWDTDKNMMSDLTSLRDNAASFADWIEQNAGDYKDGFSINREVSPGILTDEAIKVAKTEDVASRLTAFRELFGPKE